MGCTRFAEHFDRSADELAVDAVAEALDGAGLTQDDIDAFWLGTYVSGISGMALARPLRLVGKPVTRGENMCATGSEARPPPASPLPHPPPAPPTPPPP